LNIIVHHPKSEENIGALRKKVAHVHAEAAIRYIQKLSCSQEQRMKLHNEVKKAYCDKQ